jgi:hypothetical protein
MFLAQWIKTFNIYFENVAIPAQVHCPVLQLAAENHLEEKQWLLTKIKNVLSNMNNDAVWRPVGSLEQLVDILWESLVRLLSATEGLSHLQWDTLLNRLDHAKQHA